MVRFDRLACTAVGFLLLTSAGASAQLGSRPADEWIATLDGPQRVASLRIDEVVAAANVRPGQTVADIGAGSGLFSVPLARAAGPKGLVYAVEIDAGFFPQIRKRAAEAGVDNVETVLGKFTDPALPVKTIDVAFFHDVLHHIAERPAYLKTVARYLAPDGRIVVVDYQAGLGPHPGHPELEVSRAQLEAWMSAAGLTKVQSVEMFPDKYFLTFARRRQ
jgi:ubiquinone/menaquinone biosynthesis C-methylase UbiE